MSHPRSNRSNSRFLKDHPWKSSLEFGGSRRLNVRFHTNLAGTLPVEHRLHAGSGGTAQTRRLPGTRQRLYPRLTGAL